MNALEFPERFEPVRRLGQGGGGEVWAVRDRYTGERRALKMLSAGATENEMSALVREAMTLSGLEGLGVPRVLRFGRLRNRRPFMVRELVEGKSLLELIDEQVDPAACLFALAGAAEQATLLHRAGLLHGDIKPANIVVDGDGRATLVDLGLSAPWREGGGAVKGLTPKYAAPELLRGKPLTVRAEVYAFGIGLSDLLGAAPRRAFDAATRDGLAAIAERATRSDPAERYPSADEFASAVRGVAGLGSTPARTTTGGEVWPIAGIETTASRLVASALALAPGAVLAVDGPPGSGRSVLLQRLAWSLGVEGHPLSWIDAALVADDEAALSELREGGSLPGAFVVVDDADRLSKAAHRSLDAARSKGARLVVIGGRFAEAPNERFVVPPLAEHVARELLRRAVPALTDRLVSQVVDAAGGRPGDLRRSVRLIAERAVASPEELEAVLSGEGDGPASLVPEAPLSRALFLLDRGRYTDVRAALLEVDGADALVVAVAWARLELGLGDARAALERLLGVEALATTDPTSVTAKAWAVYLGRARIGLGEYQMALSFLDPLRDEPGAIGAEALAYAGLALAYLGDETEARRVLADAVTRAEAAGAKRLQALAYSCTGSVLQRSDETEGARLAYEKAISFAEAAGDAGALATAQVNLAGLLKIGGDIAGAIEHYESAVDMGRRSGRLATVRQALLNLANLDLELGRVARARSSIEKLEAQRDELSRTAKAQLLGLEAELSARDREPDKSFRLYADCADAFQELGLGVDAAEARLEGILVASRSERADAVALAAALARAAEELGESTAHRPLLALAKATVLRVDGDEDGARRGVEAALAAARESAQKDWIWRTLEVRSELEESANQFVLARRDREEALAVLEEIATRLPRDLREVFWNDPRRRKLRTGVQETLGSAATDRADVLLRRRDGSFSYDTPITSMTSTPLEHRLARILEINAELLGELDVDRIAVRVTDHAVDMLQAERGFVLLRGADGRLVAHTSRGRSGDDDHAQFSRSIAEQVVRTGEPVVAMNAKGDSRLRSFASVHQLSLESVACVPINSRKGGAIGALYVETRLLPAATFERELPTLRAFSDQVAIALETAALVRENKDRAEKLDEANQELQEAQAQLKELLGDRTEQLRRTRRKLRDARDTLYGHFGYQGLVGTSASMRKLYALIDRVKATDVPVLVTGESGTGKELAARAIHRASERGDKPFFGLNCGAVPEHLLESELFGHVRGAFTGADRERKGLFREASGGTLLLDEIGEMPQKMQTGLLRVLQERTVRPVGGSQEFPIDVRLVFATHRDLEAMVKAGTFREDLFYRIHVVEVKIPPLRERVEDIAPLVDHFLGIFAARYKRDRRSVSREAMRRLLGFAWPGNVRQLEHVLLNAWVLSDSPVLEPEDFDLPDGVSFAPHFDDEEDEDDDAPVEPDEEERPAAEPRALKENLSRHRIDEKDRIIRALQACNWNRVQAAKLSGIPRRTFYRRLREYGIQ
jgi:transcriptional regulator with GAF, ATPase, and Fis domain